MNKPIAIILGLVFVCIAAWALINPNQFMRSLIDRLEELGYDLQLRTRVLTEQPKPLNPIIIVDIDDKSLQAEGRWPWPRSKLAQLVDQLHKQGVAVIAFDMFFSEKEDNIATVVREQLGKQNLLNPSLAHMLQEHESIFDQDEQFAKSLADSQSVLAISFLPRDRTQNELPKPLFSLTPAEENELSIISTKGYICSLPLLQQAAKYAGFINVFPDSDGIVRRAPLLLEYKNNVYPALALRTILTFLGEKAELITVPYNTTKKIEGIKIGNRTIPTDAKAQVIVPYIGKSFTFPYYSATDVLHNNIKPNALLGKIVFIGTSATGAGDLQATSIQSPFPGVEIQATVANGLLGNKFSYVPAWTLGANFFLIVFIGCIAAFIFPSLGPRTLTLIIILLPISLLFINNWIWIKTGLILSLLIPVILILTLAIFNIAYGYLFETRRREQLKDMFGQYVPKKHIDEMLKSKSSFALQGEDREMSVLFADIRNFTSISENMPAAKLVEMLNTFFTPMTEIIFKHSGTIDKYVGDLIMAFWGAPLKDKQHARHAIESALEMQDKLNELNARKSNQWPGLKIGIGINSGEMSVGDMGSRFRRNYTVLGDAVNLASRIESLTKFYGVNILVTEHVQKNQSKFAFKKIDKVKVKGKEIGIEIYEVVCLNTQLTAELTQELALYQQALEKYFQRQWDDAINLFTELCKRYPDTTLYQIYMNRVLIFKNHPPAENWDGVYIHSSK